jgi:hypothetical protein
VNVLAYKVDHEGRYTDVTSEVSWVSTNADVVSMRRGIAATATAMTPGDAQIVASYEGLTDALSLTVRPWEDYETSALRLQLFSELTAGVSVQATAYLNGADQDVTPMATWTSSNPRVLTVERGRVTALKPGTARITITYDGYIDDCIVSVHPTGREVPDGFQYR